MQQYEETKIDFVCQYCNLEVTCSYFGRKPPGCKNYLLLEDAYVMVDPFQSRDKFLVIGAHCVDCNAKVCMECSIFYSKRFCKTCARKQINKFPFQVQKEI